MDLLMNGLLIAATISAGGYCWVLARRVQDLKSLDRGLGGSIVSLTRQVELARLTLEEARAASSDSRQDLVQLVKRADVAAGHLRTLIAAAPGLDVPTGPAPKRDDPGPAADVGREPRPVGSLRRGDEAGEAALPKPRFLVPVENPLRRTGPAVAEAPSSSEEDILETLSAMAAGAR
jgi:hypothetical protein